MATSGSANHQDEATDWGIVDAQKYAESFLEGLDMLSGDHSSPGHLISPPDTEVAVLESSATAISKIWTLFVGALGGTAAISTWVTSFWGEAPGGVRITLLASSAGVVIAVVLALAIIINADLRARSQGQAAIYHARAAVTAAIVKSSENAWLHPRPDAFTTELAALKKDIDDKFSALMAPKDPKKPGGGAAVSLPNSEAGHQSEQAEGQAHQEG